MAKFKKESFGLIPQKELIARLVRYYGRIESYVENNILSINASNYKKREASRAIKDLESFMRVANQQIFDFFDLNIPRTYYEARRKVKNRIEKKLKRKQKKKIENERVIDRQLRNTARTINRANESIIKTARQYLKLLEGAHKIVDKLPRETNKISGELQEFNFSDIRWQVEGIVQSTRAAGKSQFYAYRDIKNLLGTLFQGSPMIQVNGRNYKLKKYAKMLGRTEFRTAQTNATLSACKEHDVGLVRFSAHASPCRICAPLEGEIFSISGKHSRYPSLNSGDAPPVHPHCEHNLDPYDELEDLIA